MSRWAILTGEYPPQPGGVSDYSRLVARELAAAGDAVSVYAPPCAGSEPRDPGVELHRLPGHFGPRSLVVLDRSLLAQRPDRILVQYVPHAFGWKAMNLPLATWIANRARRIAPVWVMFHEVVFPFSWRPAKHALLGAVTRLMARLVVGAASRVFVATPAWGLRLRRLCPRAKPAEWLPVPSNIGTGPRPDRGELKARFPALRNCSIVGHFGTYGPGIARVLEPTLVRLLAGHPDRAAVLFGGGGDSFRDRLQAGFPELAGRVFATGRLESEELADLLVGCDLFVQPYPDGVCARRGSMMGVMGLGLPVVTNAGPATEPVWASECVALAAGPDAAALATEAEQLLPAPAGRADLARRAADVYRDTFALEHTIAKLREIL